MKATDRLKSAWASLIAPSPSVPLEAKASQAHRAAMLYRVGTEQFAPAGYRGLVPKSRTNPIVRLATKLISESVGALTPVIKIGDRAVEEMGPAGKALQARLRRPNPGQDQSAFIRDTAAFLALHGNAFVERVEGMGDYAEFYALRPELMTITPGPGGWPERYTYRPTGGAIKEWHTNSASIARAPILHIRTFAADDDLWGHGGLEAAEAEIDSYESAVAYVRAIFRNGAVPSGALRYAPAIPPGSGQPRLSEEQFQRLKSEMDNQWRGSKNAGKPLLLDGGLEWQPFAMSLVDLQAIEMRNAAARGIASAFGVPPMLLGIPGDNTYANYAEANRAFYRQTVLALGELVFGHLATWWGGLLRLDDLKFEIQPDQIWALSDEVSIARSQSDASPSLTPNEKRKRWGLDPIPDGDTLLVSGGLTPLDQVLQAELFADPVDQLPPPASRALPPPRK